MASYDSDSSGAEDGDYTETNVLLGYASKEPTDDTTSQLGGHPTWLDDKTPPSGSLAKCKVCNNFLTLLLQLNGDLPERFPGHERRLYLFGCRRKTCRRKEGSVRGFRAVRASNAPEPKSKPAAKVQPVEEEAPATQKPSNVGASLFGVKPAQSAAPGGASSSNPFATGNPFASSSSSSSSPLNPFAAASSLAAKPPQTPQQTTESPTLSESFASKARISSPEPSQPQQQQPQGPAEPWPQTSALPPPYPLYHLDADYETLDAPKHTIPANARIDMDMDVPETTSSTSVSDENKANFESAMDTTFQKFADRLAQNPEQVLRYEFAGQPLLYAKTDAVGKKLAPAGEAQGGKVQVAAAAGRSGNAMPRCANCGAERVFEVQLTPYAIVELEAEELGLEGMEWGTVILGVCAKDCVAKGVKQAEVGYVEEWTGVQWEEQVSRK